MMCNTLRLAVLAVGLVSFSTWAQPSLATPAVYFGWDNNLGDISPRPNADGAFTAFTNTLGPYGVETADNIDTSLGPFPDTYLNPPLQFSPTGITADTNGIFASDLTPFQNYAIGTKSLPETDAYFPGQMNTQFSFHQYITAFGLYVMQAGDLTHHTLTTFKLRDTATNVSDSWTVDAGPGWQDHNIYFLGLGSSFPFNEVTILEQSLTVGDQDDLSDGMVYDNIVAGNFVPEPGSLALLTLGGVCSCAIGRPRRFRRGSALRD